MVEIIHLEHCRASNFLGFLLNRPLPFVLFACPLPRVNLFLSRPMTKECHYPNIICLRSISRAAALRWYHCISWKMLDTSGCIAVGWMTPLKNPGYAMVLRASLLNKTLPSVKRQNSLHRHRSIADNVVNIDLIHFDGVKFEALRKQMMKAIRISANDAHKI